MSYDPVKVRQEAADRQAEGLPMFGGSRADAPLLGTPALPSHRDDPATSRRAAARAESHAATLRRTILDILAAAADGCTADEIECRMGWRAMTAARRLTELYRANLIRRGPDTRMTQTGCPALVYRRRA
jgi:hypothetical protein